MRKKTPRKTRPAATSTELRMSSCECRTGMEGVNSASWSFIIRNSEFAIPDLSPPDAFINKAQLFHLFHVEEISAIEHDRMRQRLAGALEVQLLELRPFGGDDQRVATLGHLVHVLDVVDILNHVLGFFHGLGIMHAESGALFLQPVA